MANRIAQVDIIMALTTVIIVVIALSTIIRIVEWFATPIAHRAALLNLMQEVETIKTRIYQERKYAFEKAEFYLGTMGSMTPSCGLADTWFLNLPEKNAFYIKKGTTTCYINSKEYIKMIENMTNMFYNSTNLKDLFGSEVVDEIKNYVYNQILYKSYFDEYKVHERNLTKEIKYMCGIHNCPPGFTCSDDKEWCERIITNCDFYRAFTDYPDSIICNASEVCPSNYSPVYRCDDPLDRIVCCPNWAVMPSNFYPGLFYCGLNPSYPTFICEDWPEIKPYDSGNCNITDCNPKFLSEGNLYFESYFQAPFCVGAWYQSTIPTYNTFIYLQRVRPLPYPSLAEFTFLPAYDEHIEATTQKYQTKIDYMDNLTTHLSLKLYLADEYEYAKSYASEEWFENKLKEYFFNLSTRYVPNIWIKGNEISVADWLAGLIINLGGVSALPSCALVPKTIAGVTYTSYECGVVDGACWNECKKKLGATFCNNTVEFKKRVENEFYEKTGYHLKINPKEIRIRVGLLCEPIDPGPEEKMLSLPIKLMFATLKGNILVNDSSCRDLPTGGQAPLANDGINPPGWKNAFEVVLGRVINTTPCAVGQAIRYCSDLRNGTCTNNVNFTCPENTFCDKNSNACISTNCQELWN